MVKPTNTDGISGWLRVLSMMLLVWQPANIALAASSMLARLTVRGPILGVALIARLLAAALGIAAGLALVNRRTGAMALARAALVASLAVDGVWYLGPGLAPNLAPGDWIVFLGLSACIHAGWLLYLARFNEL